MSVLREYATVVSQPTLPLTGAPLPRYDEVVAEDGSLRPAWKALAEQVLELTPEHVRRVDGEIARFLADEGVTYVREGGTVQPWQLDTMPLILDAASWSRLDVGLAQRAELLNALLADLYGPQTLLADGVIPAAVVLGHSGYTRAVARPSAADPHPLLLSAADLGRDAAGDWHVLADRVQAPSGLGFAMQNRRVISQVIPELYHETNLHRMEPYFSALHAALLAAAPAGTTTPTVVILSPGPLSETAFDQAFLANALGFPLVQGDDLVSHDGAVWMKPAGWPGRIPTERVDVIVRRVDAEWCDPLELRADSRLGVAGLSEAIRRGTVRLVNGLGAGVLENPGLMPYLPAACERLLGEQLRLPSVPTWWCGDPAARAEVIARLSSGDESLFVRAIDEPRKNTSGLAPDEIVARIESAPHRYVAQQNLPLSQAPVSTDSGSAAAVPLVLRAFALRYGTSFRPLVGGLATVRENPYAAPTTKDVWVLKASDIDPDQGLIDVDPLPTARAIPPLAPRALSDMFWAGRYSERTEDLLRLMLTAQQLLDRPRTLPDDDPSAATLIAVITKLTGTSVGGRDEDFRSLLLDASRRGGAAYSIARLRTALEGVRDQLSGDTWRVFAHIERAARALRSSPHAHRTAESAGRMLSSILSLHGVTANMIRDAGWHMIETGRALERALQLTHVLSVGAVTSRTPRVHRDVLEALLTASESIVTYRRRYRGSLRTADMLDLLLLDADNPRSLAFSLRAVRDHLAALPASSGSTRPERLVDELITLVDELDVVALAATKEGRRVQLATLLEELTAGLEQIGTAIAQAHFESGPPPVSLSSLSLIEELMEARA